MAGERFDCAECGMDFNMRMKLNRHIAKIHKTEAEIDYVNADELTDEQKETYFDNLREKYFELKDKMTNIDQKYKYLENHLETMVNKTIINISKPNKLRDFKGHANATGNYEHIPEDPTIPPGWKSAFKTCYIPAHIGVPAGTMKMKVYWASNGRYCSSRAQALGYMMSNEDQFRKNDIEKMKEGMMADGWKTIKELPKGWMAMPETSSKASLKYTTQFGVLLRNARSAVKYMLVNCSDEEIANFVTLQFVKDIRPSDISWIKSSSIPFRWKVGTVPRKDNICLVIICPDGQVFTGIKSLREMLAKNENFQMEDLEPFLKFLGITKYKAEIKVYGWSKAGTLPPGWMKKTRANTNMVSFLSPQGRIFLNRKQIANFMNEEGNGDKIILEPIASSRSGAADWLNDPSLPDGWTMRTGSNGKSFKDPDGQTYSSRVEAIKLMLSNSESQDDLNFMRKGLVDDGWVEVEYLPPGWMVNEKEVTKTKGKQVKTISYLTPDMQILRAFETLITHMKQSGEDDEQILKVISQKYTPDEDLPMGYFYRRSNGFTVKSYLTKDGKHFSCILLLLRHLFAIKSEDEKAVREIFLKEGYNSSEYLPTDWLYKRGDKLVYITPEYTKLKNKEVIKYLEAKGGKEKEIELFKSNFREVCPPTKINSSSFQWSEDPILPEGWKSAPYNPKLLSMQNKKLCKYLAPDGSFFNSKPAALRHMLGNGSSQDDISKMEAGLVNEGYTSSEFLPKDWRVKTGETWYIFLSPTYVTFSNVNKMKSYMQEKNFDEEAIARVVDNFKWTQLQTVKNEHVSLKRKVEEIEDVTEDDWEEHYQLPKGWKYRLNSENNLVFLTDSGYKLNSLKAAKMKVRSKDMKLDSQTEARVLSNLICFAASFRGSGKPPSPKKPMEKKSKVEEAPEVRHEETKTPPKQVEEVQEDSVPAGWKMAKFSSEHDVILTSPQGKLFLTRRAALEWMVKSQYSKEAITKMWKALNREGWREEAG